MWINRKRPGQAILRTISRGELGQLSLQSFPNRYMNVLHLNDYEVLCRALGVQRLLTLNDVIRLLRSEVKRAGSQRAFAKKANVNVSVVSKTLRGMVLPSEKILSALDLRVVYLSK